jgi:signal transduction histidine kinase/HAMP domain-containing protein
MAWGESVQVAPGTEGGTARQLLWWLAATPEAPAASSAPPVPSPSEPLAGPQGKPDAPPREKGGARRPRTRLGRRLQNLRISRKLAVVIIVHLLHATVLLGVTTYGLKMVDASRAWVDGEGFWSKAQKEAVVQLLDYSRSGDESRFRSALAQINVTLGDRQARLELEKPSPDLAVVRDGFIQARNHPDDVGNMIWLFQTFRHESHIEHAIAIWTRAEDDGIQPLRALADELHGERSMTHPDLAQVNATVGRILAVDIFLEGLEHEFSTTLGDAARFINLVVVVGTVALTLLFVGSALLVSAAVARQITRSLGRVKAGAEQMAQGNVGVQIEVEGRDDVAQVAQAFNSMSQQLAKTMGEREAQASTLAATLESTTDGLLVVDNGGRIVQFNKNFSTMWRIPEEIVASRSDERALAFVVGQLADPNAFLAKVKALYDDPDADSFDTLAFKDGRVFERYSKPQRIQGRNVGRVWSFRDVTERVHAEQQQQRALAQAEENKRLHELDRMKSDFINSAAHELRTPMTPIRVEMHILRGRKAEFDDKTRHSVEILDRNLVRLGRLVEDVLEGARLQSGHLGVTKQPMDLAKMVRECVDSFQSAAKEKGISLEAHIPPCAIEGDAQRLSQVVYNLLSNALKFTPKGGFIDVNVQPGANEVMVSVRDTGVGIPREKQAQLFRPFSQLHEQTGLRKSGTGLGLYISKGIIDAHAGKIGYKSEGADKGSTFYFTVPTKSPREPKE